MIEPALTFLKLRKWLREEQVLVALTPAKHFLQLKLGLNERKITCLILRAAKMQSQKHRR